MAAVFDIESKRRFTAWGGKMSGQLAQATWQAPRLSSPVAQGLLALQPTSAHKPMVSTCLLKPLFARRTCSKSSDAGPSLNAYLIAFKNASNDMNNIAFKNAF